MIHNSQAVEPGWVPSTDEPEYIDEFYSVINDNITSFAEKMNGSREHHIKQNKPDSERQTSHIFSHTQNLDFFLET
jgi:hypothetical protein